MQINTQEWKVNKAIKLRQSIDPKPQYQRGSVWTVKKNRLLIDSILRGMDIPKFYLRKTPDESIYNYEVADGQQRLRAIWDFYDNVYDLQDCVIGDIDISGFYYKDLVESTECSQIINLFKNFPITIALIEEATDDDVRTLFARLQMGTALNQPELRNAVASNIGYAIDMVVNTHPFFADSTISTARFKRQDFLAHVITLIHFTNTVDLKADAIMSMYEKLAITYPKVYFKKANAILNWMNEINAHCNKQIKNKWAFVDFFWMLYRHYTKINNIDCVKLGKAFIDFEKLRLKYNKRPEDLIENKRNSTHDKDLYSYIMAFNYSGGLTSNINARAEVFDNTFLQYITLK